MQAAAKPVPLIVALILLPIPTSLPVAPPGLTLLMISFTEVAWCALNVRSNSLVQLLRLADFLMTPACAGAVPELLDMSPDTVSRTGQATG